MIVESKLLALPLSEKKINLAFSYCKMTVIDEVAEKNKLTQLEFVEFLEFLARIAQIVFKENMTMKLYDKVFYVFKRFFELIPAEVIEPVTEYDVESESDNEEYL
jgi:hypothetical protein